MIHSAHDKIQRKINRSKPGSILFPSDFRGMGSDIAIKNALSRLAKAGKIDRLAHGLYYLPEHDPKFGKLLPSLEKIAQAVAQRDHVRIKPAGAFAIHKLGLSTQVPMKQVYITSGQPKRLKMGTGIIVFKSTTAKKLALKGPISSLVIQALEEIDPKDIELDPGLREKITKLLATESPSLLQHDLKLAPARISDFIFKLIIQNKHFTQTD
ncbi:MAG TPA: DUF6088 family protein [Puia sp.]|uniref:DUF6088 family protein n=1 Tax=Puia sp. TaxID=2045100 RepID=UPI002BE6F390|nr:DUF6088 family protein [Puia sp.]HVU96077.1 DUF6088 family protein [Puia sp.]